VIDETLLITSMSVASSGTTFGVDLSATALSAPEPVGEDMPPVIPADQVYYWSSEWRRAIAQSHAALEAGDYVEFDSDDPNDIVRWFLSDDDD
jgi:hypothetical protein